MSEHANNKVVPTSWAQASNSDYITAADLCGREVTVKIREVELRELENDKGVPLNRIVLWFEGKDKGMVSNTTNNLILRAMFKTEDPRAIVGKRITIHPERVQFGRETVDGIRVIGSPDIASDITVEIKLPKKRAERRVLVKTGAATAPATPQVEGGNV